MQINLFIQALIHLFKQVFIDYLNVISEGEEINVSVSLSWAVEKQKVGNRKVSEKWFLYFKKLKIYLKNGYINSNFEDRLLPAIKNFRCLAGVWGFIFQVVRSPTGFKSGQWCDLTHLGRKLATKEGQRGEEMFVVGRTGEHSKSG